MYIVFSEQAGDLYEKIGNYQRALDCYCKGGAYRKGETSVRHVKVCGPAFILYDLFVDFYWI